jgi:hypothetical protein
MFVAMPANQANGPFNSMVAKFKNPAAVIHAK